MTWLRRAPRCPICKRKLADCHRARWLARRMTADAATLVVLPCTPTADDLRVAVAMVTPDPPDDLAAS